MAKNKRVQMQTATQWRFWASGTDINPVLQVVHDLIPKHEDYMRRVSFGDREDDFEPELVMVHEVTLAELAALLGACATPPEQSTILPAHGVSVRITDAAADKPHHGMAEAWAELSYRGVGTSVQGRSHSSLWMDGDARSDGLQARIRRAIAELAGGAGEE